MWKTTLQGRPFVGRLGGLFHVHCIAHPLGPRNHISVESPPSIRRRGFPSAGQHATLGISGPQIWSAVDSQLGRSQPQAAGATLERSAGIPPFCSPCRFCRSRPRFGVAAVLLRCCLAVNPPRTTHPKHLHQFCARRRHRVGNMRYLDKVTSRCGRGMGWHVRHVLCQAEQAKAWRNNVFPRIRHTEYKARFHSLLGRMRPVEWRPFGVGGAGRAGTRQPPRLISSAPQRKKKKKTPRFHRPFPQRPATCYLRLWRHGVPRRAPRVRKTPIANHTTRTQAAPDLSLPPAPADVTPRNPAKLKQGAARR